MARRLTLFARSAAIFRATSDAMHRRRFAHVLSAAMHLQDIGYPLEGGKPKYRIGHRIHFQHLLRLNQLTAVCRANEPAEVPEQIRRSRTLRRPTTNSINARIQKLKLRAYSAERIKAAHNISKEQASSTANPFCSLVYCQAAATRISLGSYRYCE
ncbi:MAG: hypothetical protein ABIZ64_00750 [Casimicrobium sp.]|jgi:hypothetical protein